MAWRRPGANISFMNIVQSVLPGQPEGGPRRAEGATVVQVGSIGGGGGVGNHDDSHDSHPHHSADLPDLHDIRQIWNPGAERMLDLSTEALAHF